ncbi:MAG: MMPL family transporter, partial [Thermoplasmata archaeon]|nr:MMPL family transporter [Thermoplasmata archaeon]NIS13750.1 MMPL family transporter [Thermoplasmata archaeon]NIS18872.1 MMPL family transporter [Thermoplasmata archaeon]NIT75902.1 MMPL family transporter [Thermoplasmata archaeon]NIU48026.1 MMPL family transporter [Thermoplasmata archaeon]
LELEERILAPEAGDIDITDTLQPTESVPTGVQSIADLVAMAAMTLQGAEMFGVEMANTTSMLDDLNETLAMIALGIIYMDHGNNESVGSNLTQTEYALGQIVEMLEGMGGNGGNGGNGNGGIGFPDLATIRQVLEAMDDTAVKGTIVGMNNFDSTPLEMAVAGTVTARETTRATSEPTTGTVGAPINTLLMDEAFMGGNYTFMGFPVDHEMLMLDSLAHLQFIYLALGQITGFEAQPFVLDNVLTGLSAGLGFVLATDYDSSSMQPSSKASLMIVQQNRSVDSDRILESQYDLEDIAKGVEKENADTIEFGVMGAQIMFDKINTSSMESLGTLMGLAMVFIVVILFLVFRSGLDTFLTLIALVFVIIWTFGIGIILGYTFNPLTTAVPILLVGLAVDYGIHLTVRNRLEKRKETLDRSTILTIASVGTALLLATITTVFSFMSNLLSDLSVMRQFGILTSVGIVSAFFVMNTFVPAARLLYDRRRERLGKRRGGKGKRNDGPRKENRLVTFVQLGAHGAASYSTPIVVGALLLSGGAFYAISDIETTFDFMDFLPEDLPETKTINFLLNNFNFSSSTTDVLMEGDIATANVFASMETTQDNLLDVRDVVKVGNLADARSPLTVVQKYGLPTSPAFVPDLGTAFAASDTNGDGVPDTGVPTLLDTYMAHPSSAGEMRGVLHPDEDGGYDAAIIRVGVRDAPDNGAKLTE